MAGITIKDAPLVERLKLNDKFPVSNGSGLPISANLQQVKTLVNDGNATKEDLESKQDKIEDLESIRQGALKGSTAIQEIPSEYITESKLNNKGYATKQELTNKVDKVIGKQLSTEDFTTLLKLKLEGLYNYDDTEINQVVSKLRTDLDILVNGDTTTAIKTFNEVIAFLDGLEDTESLKSIIASIEMLIASKQDNISDLKEIREGSNKGKTSVQPEELSNVAKSGSYDDLNDKPYIPAEITESTVEQWGFTKNEGTYTKPNDGIPRSDLSGNVLSSLNKADTALQEHQDISGKVDKVEGKQLSTEDFTTTLKERLLTLSNYDDTELNKALEKLREDLDSLVDGDSTTAIESFNEIIAFLEGIEDSENLDSILASIEHQIADIAKNIPSKVSELENDKGYLTEHQDISGKADKNNYTRFSTEETRIGTWIDGKPIYRKTIVYTCEDLTKTKFWAYYPSDTTGTEISSMNIESYVGISGITFCANQAVTAGAWQPIPRICPDANEAYNIGFGDLKPTRVGVLFGNKYLSATVYLTIEYTKTTD